MILLIFSADKKCQSDSKCNSNQTLVKIFKLNLYLVFLANYKRKINAINCSFIWIIIHKRMLFNIYFRLRFGLTNAFNNYLMIKICFVCGLGIFNHKCLLIKFAILNPSQIYLCIPDSFNKNISQPDLDYTITFVNSRSLEHKFKTSKIG